MCLYWIGLEIKTTSGNEKSFSFSSPGLDGYGACRSASSTMRLIVVRAANNVTLLSAQASSNNSSALNPLDTGTTCLDPQRT